MRFITRELIHLDRIVTAWANRRFVDVGATFEFVLRTRDFSGAGGILCDLRGGELDHHQGCCTLEALIDEYEIADEAPGCVARIIRAADLPQDGPAPAVAPGVPPISHRRPRWFRDRRGAPREGLRRR